MSSKDKKNTPVSILYLCLMAIPPLTQLPSLVWVFTAPQLEGLPARLALLGEVLGSSPSTLLRWGANYALYLIICGFGYLLFSRGWRSRDAKLAAMVLLGILIWVLQQPGVYGVEVFSELWGLNLSFRRTAPWLLGVLQPQCVLSLLTVGCILSAYGKRPGAQRAIYT